VSDHGKALDRLWAHEARRTHRWRAMPVPLDERRWIASLDSPELERHVRELNGVDRAVKARHEARSGATFSAPAQEQAA
jgi:hypothetical protein